MEFENKKLRDVADVAARIMMGEKALHPNQQKLDVHEPEKDKLTAKDFEMLRNKKKVKEETEQLDEDNLDSIAKKHGMELKRTTYGAGMKHPTHGEVSINRYGEWNHKGKTGDSSNKFSSLDKHLGSLKEDVEELDEVSLKTASSAYAKRIGQNEPSSQDKAVQTIQQIAKKHGASGVATAAKTAEKEALKKVQKEEIDHAAATILEYESKDGKFVHRARPGAYGGTKDEKHAVDTLSGPKEKELKNIEKDSTMYKKGYHGTSKHYLRKDTQDYFAKRFSENLELYKEQGLKGLFASLVKEEPDNEQFTKEVEAQKAKNAGEGKKAEVAKPAVQAVQNEEYDVLDYNEVNGVRISEIDLEESSDDYEVKQDKKDPDVHHVHYKGKKIGYVYGNKRGMFGHEYHAMGTGDDGYSSKKQAVNAVKADHKYHISGDYLKERTLTEPEMKKKEEIVKSMKKGIAGFKERYGDRAKNVMYATATKRAMGEDVEQINEAITHGDYIITHKPYNGTDKQRHVSNDITHAYSTNQKKLGIKHSEDDDEIGPDRHITVKNKKTGEVSHHVATHNNSYKDEGEKQKISIRAHSEVTPHDEKHAKVIKSFLTQKS